MDTFLVFLGVDTAIEKGQNQIGFENFIVQAQSKDILKYKPGCMKGWYGEPLDKNPIGMKSIYNILYDCLVEVGIIEKKRDKYSIITLSSSYTITKDTSQLEPVNIEELLKDKNSADFKELNKCFDIDYNKLSDLLKKYVYDSTDQFLALKPGKKGGKKKKRKTVKRRKCK